MRKDLVLANGEFITNMTGDPTRLQERAEAKLKTAIAAKIDRDIESAEAILRALAARKGTEKLIEVNAEDTTYERFHETFNYTAEKLGFNDLVNDIEAEVVTAAFCLKKRNGPDGFLSALPKDMFNHEDDNFLKRVNAAWRLLEA